MVLFGIDQIRDFPEYKSTRAGLVTNDAALNLDLMPARRVLQEAGIQLAALFSPEHGLPADGVDGAAMPHRVDLLTGLPVYSLYGAALRPDPAVLRDLDCIFLDLPDIGVRFYTYIWTLSHVMESCAEAGIPLIVLDRPNPIGGKAEWVEGPVLDETTCASFIGRWAIPVRHSLTIGELARYWQTTRLPNLDLRVIGLKNWNRDFFWSDTGRPFIPPSPAIASIETPLLYPMLCFLEATPFSEGRGTAWPFRICGSPWFRGVETSERFNAFQRPGVRARPISFTPAAGKFVGRPCEGLMFHVVDARAFRPVSAGLLLISILRDMYPAEFYLEVYPTLVNPAGRRHFDLLAGNTQTAGLTAMAPEAFARIVDDVTRVENWAHMDIFKA